MAINEYSFVTLEEVKGFMGMTGSVSETDDFLESLIDRVSTLFESYMGRKILSREYTEYHNGRGLSVLFPEQPYITTISGVWDDEGWSWASSSEIDSTEYRVSFNNYITLKDTILGDFAQNIKIIYTAGFSAVPDDLKHACITEIVRAYKNRNQVDIVSRTLADGSVNFSAKDLLPLTKLTLDSYRNIGIV